MDFYCVSPPKGLQDGSESIQTGSSSALESREAIKTESSNGGLCSRTGSSDFLLGRARVERRRGVKVYFSDLVEFKSSVWRLDLLQGSTIELISFECHINFGFTQVVNL